MLEVFLQHLPAKLAWATTTDATFEGWLGNMVADQWNSGEKIRYYNNNNDKAGRCCCITLST